MIAFLLDGVVWIGFVVIAFPEFVLLAAVTLVARWVCDEVGVPRVLPEGTAALVAVCLFVSRIKEGDV